MTLSSLRQPFRSHRAYAKGRWLAVGCLLSALVYGMPVLAQTANFGEITLSAGFGEVDGQGTTAGFFGLSNMVSRDRDGNLCLGYADTAPDFTLNVQQNFDTLTLAVSSGEDTTLMVQGPNDGTIRCNDNASRRNDDAEIVDSFQAGTYRVWVGAFDRERRHRYVLTVSE